MRVVFVALMLSLGVSGCTGSSVSRRNPGRAATGAYLRGLMMERSANFPAALDSYHSALEHDRNSPQLHIREGATYVKLGDMDQALQSFAKALELDPRHPDALRWLAMLYASQGKLEPAVAAYEQLLPQEPDDQFVLSTLADLYVLQDQLPKAVALYERLIMTAGSSSQLHFNLGVLYGRMGQFREAIQELSRAYELAPESMETRLAMGLTYELSGRPEHAAAYYEDAIRLDPFNPKLYHHAARAHLSARQSAEAAANYQAVLDLTPHDLEAITGLVRAWMAQQRFADAAHLLAQKLRELGDPPELYLALGLVYREAEQAQESMRAFERAIAKRPDYAQAHFYLAAQLDQLDRKREARISLQRTLELDQDHSDAMNYLGYLDVEAGEHLPEAKALIEQALALDPENGAYVDSLGWACYKLGRLEEAIAHLERAANLLGSDPVIFDHLGDAYLKHHEPEKAREYWLRALDLDPTLTTVKRKLEQMAPHEATAGTVHP